MKHIFNPGAPMRTGSVQLLLNFAEAAQIPLRPLLRNTGLSPEDCSDVDGVILAWQELQLVRNMHRIWPDGLAFGLQVGQDYRITSYGMWGLAMMASATLGEAAKIGIEYLDVASRFNNVKVRLEGDYRVISLHSEHLPKDIQRFMIGRDLASIAMLHEGLLPQGNSIVSKLVLGFPKEDYPEFLFALYGCETEHKLGCHEVWIEDRWYSHPLPQANAATAALCVKQCQRELERLNNATGVSGKVKLALWEQLASTPSMERVASNLNMSSRSLRRHLESEGTGWRELVARVRMQKAERLLADTETPIHLIANDLGYSDRSAFSHAFKRIKKVSPELYRQRFSTERQAG